jgi:hypothetical protein
MNECLTFTMKKFNNFEEDFPFSLTHTDLFNSKVFNFALKMFTCILYEDTHDCFYLLFPMSTIQTIYKQIETNANNKLCSSREYVPAIFL